MILRRRISTLFTVILILLLQGSLEAKHARICPLGFELAQHRKSDSQICYRLKGPETFADVFKNCSGNLYTSTLYDELSIRDRTEQVLWTEYQSAYVGGPFIDGSFTETAGSLLYSSFDVNNTQRGIGDKICLAKHPVGNYTTERCDNMYYRYCFVEPYPEDEKSQEECEDMDGSVKFWSPKPICLTAVKIRNGSVRATWKQSEKLCKSKMEGGSMLYHGWRYANNPKLLSISQTDKFPLHVKYANEMNVSLESMSDHMLWNCGGWIPLDLVVETHPCTYEHDKMRFIDSSLIRLRGYTTSPDTVASDYTYGALIDNAWTTVNSSYVFYGVICERELTLENVTLTLKTIDKELILTTNRKVDVEDDISCFTDSVTYYPQPVMVRKQHKTNRYIIIPRYSGYYWCITKNPSRYLPSESNKFLWIREKDSLIHKYAVEIIVRNKYTLYNTEHVKDDWDETLKEYIYYYSKYMNTTESKIDVIEDNEYFNELLRQYKYEHPKLNYKDDKLISWDMAIKKIYLEGNKALLHIELDPRKKPVPPGSWDDIRVVYMRPVHYCSVAGQLFENKLTHDCKIYSCSGDYNSGKVPIVISNDTEDEFCKPRPPVMVRTSVTLNMPGGDLASERNNVTERIDDSNSSEDSPEVTTDTTTATSTASTNTLDPVVTASPSFPSTATIPSSTETPTTTTQLPPDEQLQQVMDDLKQILDNDSVSIADIRQPFEQVDNLLANDDELQIPAQLLHLLDRIGNNLKLTGTEPTQEIRNNIALVAVNADPAMPVNGLSIAVRENDNFTNEAFQVLRNEIDCNQLLSDTSEAVVRLPGSVANSTRRVSFVVFRNDRAFRTNVTNETVSNSRVLSINVENTTHFENGEVINIYLRPIQSQPNRNQSRSCGYWKMIDNNTSGYWSQEGCEFIPASAPGKLDTCQCSHLTHFAEILVPRTVFSELDEKILEILSVIGCCLSIIGLTIVGITAVLFRSWRRDFNNKVWLQLCIAIFVLMLCFLITVFVQFRTHNVGCMMLGIVLHYSVLASFCWMLVAAVLSYKRLVRVFSRDATHKLLRASAFGWGFPIAVVGVLLASAPDSYKQQFEDITPTGNFCYPSGLGLWLAVYAPIAVMLLANWTLFVLILRSVFGSRGIDRHGDTNEALRCASVSCLLVFLFGLPWIFGLFATNVVSAYFFAVTATFQGFVLFIFFVVGNKKTRDLWLNKLRIKQTLKVPVTSSTYTNRSTGGNGPGWRGAQGSVEARVTKPRSLTNSNDNSRFS